MKQYLWNTETLMNMSKYPSLPNFELISSKMEKLQDLEKYLLWLHTDVIQALNLESYNPLKNLNQNTLACQICTFHLEKYQSSRSFMFPFWTSLWRHTNLEFENK